MAGANGKGPGRPRVAQHPGKITITCEAGALELADSIAADMPLVVTGVRVSRGDVIRAALTRGLEAMRAEVDAKLRG